MSTITVTIVGPNLRDQSHGQFHAHAAGCADLTARKYGAALADGWTVEAETDLDVVAAIYGDHLVDYGRAADTPEGRAMLRADFAWDVHLAPCLRSLRVEEVQSA